MIETTSTTILRSRGHDMVSEVVDAGRMDRETSLTQGPDAKSCPLVSLEKVSKHYGSFIAVEDVSFELNAGQFLTILGPSGCGKSTLLRLIAGFIELSHGHVRIDGRPVDSVPPHRRSIGMVFQKLALFPHMTVYENVAFPLKMRRFDPRSIPDRVDRYLKLVRLGGFQERRISELSGGQQQRVAIARALVFEPALLLLDEPLAALDKKLREEMQVEFRRIQRELGVTTINVTHDQREALVMSDQVLVMNEARVQQFDTPATAYRRPKNRFVADFIGMTNFLGGPLLREDRSSYVLVNDRRLELFIPSDTAIQLGARVDCGIRAQHVCIGERAANAEVKFAGHVLEAVFEGERIIYEVSIPDLGGLVLKAICHLADQEQAIPPGSTTMIGWDAKKLLVFPE